MKPALVIGVAMVAIVVIAAVFVLGSGGSDTPASGGAPVATTTPGTSTATATPPVTPSIAPAAASPATAAFEAWAAPLRAAGLEVTAESVTTQGADLAATGLVIAGPSAAEGWRWSAASAVLGGAATGSASIRVTGSQQLALGAKRLALAGAIDIAIERNTSDAITGVAIDANGLSITEGDGPATVIGALALHLVPGVGEGALAAETTGGFRATDIVLPDAGAPALGTEIDLIAADLRFGTAVASFGFPDIVAALSAPGGVALTGLEIRWGVADAAGEGTIGLDASRRLSGSLALALPDALTVLDAFNAFDRFDRETMAQLYAAIIDELGPDPTAPRPFIVDLTDGHVVVRGAPRGVGDLDIATLQPVLPAP